MTERQMQFRVGLFVLLSVLVGAGLIFQFSNVKDLWQETYLLVIHFEEAPGIRPGSPVKQTGIGIGRVKSVELDPEAGGVLVAVEIHADWALRNDSRPQLVRSLFGDARIEFTAGKSRQPLPPNSRVVGLTAVDPMEVVQRLESNVSLTLGAFEETTREWTLVGRNLNNLVNTREGDLDEVLERTAVALSTFTNTMQHASVTLQKAGQTLDSASLTVANANQLLADPQLQADLRATVAGLPKMVEETRATIAAARISVTEVGRNLENLSQATDPLAKHSDEIVRRLAGSLIQMEAMLTELNKFSKVLNDNDGSLQQFVNDPELYNNLNRSTVAMNSLLRNLEPMLSDLQIFSDKVARHPELLGVSGAMKGSSGLKVDPEVEPASFSLPLPSRQK